MLMRLSAPSSKNVIDWLEEQGFVYAAMPEDPLTPSSQAVGLILVEDAAILPLHERFADKSQRNTGQRVDVYSAVSNTMANFSGLSFYSETMSRDLLDNTIAAGGMRIPEPELQLAAGLFHMAYHRAERSGFDTFDTNTGRSSRFKTYVDGLLKNADVTLSLSLSVFHDYLKQKGYAASADRLVSYAELDYERRGKSYFYGYVLNELPGEVNLFVLRDIAVKQKGGIDYLLDELGRHYKIITVKKVSWQFRMFKSKLMRGGKWKRGGKPAYAVVVFDSSPISTEGARTAESHPHVFNARQFFKPELRVEFARKYGVKEKLNPMHSTDNESEALGHLPLFFSDKEVDDTNKKIAKERSKLEKKQCVD